MSQGVLQIHSFPRQKQGFSDLKWDLHWTLVSENSPKARFQQMKLPSDDCSSWFCCLQRAPFSSTRLVWNLFLLDLCSFVMGVSYIQYWFWNVAVVWKWALIFSYLERDPGGFTLESAWSEHIYIGKNSDVGMAYSSKRWLKKKRSLAVIIKN